MRKKTHKLVYKPEYDFLLIGIASHENDYRLSWAINQEFNFKLIKGESIRIISKNSPVPQHFSLYTYDDEETKLSFNLISNRCDDGFLIEEHKNFDYFLQVHGDCPPGYGKLLAAKLKNASIILATFEIDASKLKSKQKLIF